MVAHVTDAPDQADGESNEGSDSKPPNLSSRRLSSTTPAGSANKTLAGAAMTNGNGTTRPAIPGSINSSPKKATSGTPTVGAQPNSKSIPLPAPDAHAYPKEPGLTHSQLSNISQGIPTPNGGMGASAAPPLRRLNQCQRLPIRLPNQWIPILLHRQADPPAARTAV